MHVLLLLVAMAWTGVFIVSVIHRIRYSLWQREEQRLDAKHDALIRERMKRFDCWVGRIVTEEERCQFRLELEDWFRRCDEYHMERRQHLDASSNFRRRYIHRAR